MRIRLLAIAAIGVGCGASPEKPVVKPSAGTAEPQTAKLAKVPETYAAFTHADCKVGKNCAVTFAARAGVELGAAGTNPVPNPRAHQKNPDPEWLVEWLELPTGDPGAHYVFEALTLAAVHKTWRRDCEKAYEAYSIDLSQRLAQMNATLKEKSNLDNAYERLSTLLTLPTDAPKKDRLSEFERGSDPVRFLYETGVFTAFEDSGRTFVYNFDGHAPSDALLEVIHPRQSKDYELEAYCLDASQGRIEGVAPLPDTSKWDGHVRAMVKPVVSTERADYVARRRKEMAEVVRAQFAKVKQPNPQLPPGIREMTITKILSFKLKPRGEGAVVTTLSVKEDRVSLPGGGTRVSKIDDNATIDFKDWPPGLVIAPGDTISFYGAELSVKETIVQSTKDLEHRSRDYAIDARHITKVTAAGKTSVYFR